MLNRVDVVIEVRDARIPASTTHPMVDAWLKNRNTKRIVALNKVDMVPRSAVAMWEAYLANTLKIPSVLVNGKTGGKGIDMLKREILSKLALLPHSKAMRPPPLPTSWGGGGKHQARCIYVSSKTIG